MPIITGNPINVTLPQGSTINSLVARVAPIVPSLSSIAEIHITAPSGTPSGTYLFACGDGIVPSYGGEVNLLNGAYTDKYVWYSAKSGTVRYWDTSTKTGIVDINTDAIRYNGADTYCVSNDVVTVSYFGAIVHPDSNAEICAFPSSSSQMAISFPEDSTVATQQDFRDWLMEYAPEFLLERNTYLSYPSTGTYYLLQDGANTLSSSDSFVTLELDYTAGGIESPKTNWTANDRFNYYDYNRIKSNVDAVDVLAGAMFPSLTFDSTGNNMPSYESGTFARYPYAGFNAFENNLDKVATALNMDIGAKQTFYAESRFPLWTELNRLESAIETLYNVLIDMT